MLYLLKGQPKIKLLNELEKVIPLINKRNIQNKWLGILTQHMSLVDDSQKNDIYNSIHLSSNFPNYLNNNCNKIQQSKQLLARVNIQTGDLNQVFTPQHNSNYASSNYAPVSYNNKNYSFVSSNNLNNHITPIFPVNQPPLYAYNNQMTSNMYLNSQASMRHGLSVPATSYLNIY